MLEGSVRKAGKRLRITAELVNAADGFQLWSERYDRELEDIFEIQDEIARTIADRLKITLTGGAEVPLASRATDNVTAYEAYLKGRALLYKRGRFILDALTCFEEAVALDPDYALAWAGLADGRSTLGLYGMVAPHEAMPQGKEAAMRAVQIDGSLAEAHCTLALAAALHDFDVSTVRRELLRAIELNPKYPQATAWFALFVLSWIEGQFDEAVTLITPVVDHDPLSGYTRAVRSWLLAFSGRYDEGIAEALAAVELDPESFVTHWILQGTYTLAGRYPEAIVAGHAALAVSGRHPFAMFTMGVTYADWGKQPEARTLHDELMMRADRQWVSPAVRASTAATAGLTDDVVPLITRAMEERDPFLMISLGAWPLTARLRQALKDDVLWGISCFFYARADLKRARATASEILELSERDDDVPALYGHWMTGATSYSMGELEAGRFHLERTVSLHHPEKHRGLGLKITMDPAAGSMSYTSCALALLGYPDQGARLSKRSIEVARSLSHPFSEVFALLYKTLFHQLCADDAKTREVAETQEQICREQGFHQQELWARAHRLSTQKDTESLAQAASAREELDRGNFRLHSLVLFTKLADGLSRIGLLDEALATLDAADGFVEDTDERNLEAELHRLRGVVLEARSQYADAETCYKRAVDVARRQEGKLLELRATTTLARLLLAQDRTPEARTLLSGIYGWFTEGFDTVDLQEAKELLDKMG